MKLPPTPGVVHAGRSSGAPRTAQPVGQPGHVGAARLPSDPGQAITIVSGAPCRIESRSADTQRNRLAGGAVEDPTTSPPSAGAMRRRRVGRARTPPGRRPRTRRRRPARPRGGRPGRGRTAPTGDEIGGQVQPESGRRGPDRRRSTGRSGTGGRRIGRRPERTSGRWCRRRRHRTVGGGGRPTTAAATTAITNPPRCCSPHAQRVGPHRPTDQPPPPALSRTGAVITAPVRDKARVGSEAGGRWRRRYRPATTGRGGGATGSAGSAAQPAAAGQPRRPPEEAAARTQQRPAAAGPTQQHPGAAGGRRHGEVQCRLALQALIAVIVSGGADRSRPAHGRWPRGRPGRRGHGSMGRPTCSSAHRPWPDRPWPWPGRPGPSPCRESHL